MNVFVKRLILFISHYHTSDFGLFWLDLASLHYAHEVQRLLANHRIPHVQGGKNPLNVHQARPIETTWTLMEQKVYENNWET